MAALPDGVYTRPDSNIYWLRIGIPKDLRDTFPLNQSGKPPVDAYRKSLGTSDKEVARAKALVILADHAADFTKRRLAKLAATTPPTQPMSEALADHLAALATWEILAFDDLSRLNLPELVPPLQFFSDQPPPNSALLHRHAQGSDAIAREMLLNAAAGSFEEALEFAQRSCQRLGISIDWQTGLTTLSLIRIQRALAAAWMQAGARSRGDLVETPRKPVFAPGGTAAPLAIQSQSQVAPGAPAASGKSLSDVIPMWEDKTSAKPPVAQAMRRAVKYYIEATGSEALASLSKASGAQFERFLLDAEARGFRSKTAKNYAASINALVNVAVRNDLIPRNPLSLDIDASRDAERREPWTDEQLAAMTGSTLFTGDLETFPTWRDVSPKDARAALLLVMHTGARIGEIAQLRSQDFETRNNIRTIRITGDAGTVKTASSERIIPIAQHLLDDPWFARWLAALAPNGAAFPSLHGRQGTNPGDVMGRWFRRFREYLKFPAGGLEGAHKFRHWIRTKLAEADVSDATADSITGHSATGSAGRTTYTAAASLATMKAALDRLSYPDISGLKK